MDPNSTWLKILDKIRSQINSANYRTWFNNTSLGSIDQNHVTILVPSAFIKGQLVTRYESLIKQAIKETLGFDEVLITYVIDSSLTQKKTPLETENNEDDIFQLQSTSTQKKYPNPLNPKYNLANFVVGLTNNLAYAAAQAIVQNPGTTYNPLFIYGPSGVGKTHLMQGVGNSLLNKRPNLKVLYISSERFMVDFVDSIQTKRMGEFKRKYRDCDVFLVDDIQFISGKDSLQEEFFHTFNELHGKNAQIILTSDKPPNEIQKLEPRLASRFHGGLMVDIQLPDFDTRVAILKAKLLEKQETLPNECLNLIAETIESNTRELEGKLIQVLQMAKLSTQPVNLELVKKVLGKSSSITQQQIDHKKVLNVINQYFNVKISDLTGPRRQKELVLPRQLAMYILYEDCNISMERVGQILGGRDHTTVLHGIEKIKTNLTKDREVQKIIIDIRQNLTA